MQDVDNHNMDELFRKAAANYPLKAGDSDWDKIAPALLSNTGTMPDNSLPAAAPHKKSRFRKYGAILLLPILLLLFGGIFTEQEKTGALPGIHRHVDRNIPTAAREALHLNKKHAEIIPGPQTANTIIATQHNSGVTKQETVNRNTKNIADWNETSLYAVKLPSDHSIDEVKTGDRNKPGIRMVALQPATSLYTIANGLIAGKTLPGNIIPLAGNATDLLFTDSVHKTEALQKQRGIYWGVVMGPSFNQVKSQEWIKPGFDAGIIGGYRFNNRISLETGFLFSKKYYYSDGKYFSMSKAGDAMPAGMKILELEGSSSLFEIPVKFNYSLWQRPKSNLFVAAGVSSYIMTREKNNYHTMMNGTPGDMTGYYKDVSRYAAVVAGFSAGYEFKTGRSVRIRIEPYVKLPLKGIGIGSMPVTSTGIHIGLLPILR